MRKVKLCLGVVIMGTLLIAPGCVKSNISGPSTSLSESDYFDFATRGVVKISMNYNSPNNQAHVEIYDQDPVEVVNGAYIKKNISPVYSAFTNKDGKLEANMYIPTAVEEAYAYTNRWGLPTSVKLTATATGFEYDSAKAEVVASARPTTKAALSNFTGAIPYQFGVFAGAVDPNLFLKSICKWDEGGKVGKEETGDDYVSITENFNGEAITTISKRVQNFFDATDNKKDAFLTSEGETNIQVLTNDTELDVVFVAERGAYINSVGYYYYKAGSAPESRIAMWKMPKYILFPAVEQMPYNSTLPAGSTARLQFFGENYDQPAIDKFPAGYVVGWFFISNGFERATSSFANAWMHTPSNFMFNNSKTIFYSNDRKNDPNGDLRRFVMLKDVKTGLSILGFEDQVKVSSTEDYSDVLFFVKSSKEIDNPGVEIPDPDPTPEIKTLTLSGTVAFEDIWPYGGDYDLNDVAVAYERVIRYTATNDIVDITESFTYKHAEYAATFNNFFAIQVANEGVSKTVPTGIDYESATRSFIISTSAKSAGHPTYTITRTFAAGVNKDVIANDFNPYIIIGSAQATTYPREERVEVHLPKHKATSLAKQIAGEADDAYYVKKDGSYPFAIDIAESNYVFTLAKEMQNIGIAYPKFNSWASSRGTTDKDWYKFPVQ